MNAPCAATTGEGESCELKNDLALPPVDGTLNEVTNKHIQPVNEGLQLSEQLPNLVKQDIKNIVLSAQVRLISAVRLPANHAAAVPVKINEIRGSALIESDSLMDDCLQVDQSIVEVNKDGLATLLITNNGKLPCQLQSGVELAQVCEVDVEMLGDTNQTQETMSCAELPEVSSLSEYDETSEQPFEHFRLRAVSSASSGHVCSNEHIEWRQQQLRKTFIASRIQLSDEGSSQLGYLLAEYHDTFSLSDNERGETDLVEFKINTGDAPPKKQAARRIPFAARQEIAKQLEEMQKNNVIKPSKSPWASPVVLVRKRDGTLRFYVDYRALNSVTKPDVFPLPRINDLLDQLGKSRYFTTLDLKSGYWQIKVHADSQEKTAFIIYKGLFEFRVMPFGVTNAPAVFQRLMQQVLAGLQSERGAEFVSGYLDDVIVFSETLMDHINHLKAVFDCLKEAGLMLNLKKCKVMCNEVEYLGHVVTPHGLKRLSLTITIWMLSRISFLLLT